MTRTEKKHLQEKLDEIDRALLQASFVAIQLKQKDGAVVETQIMMLQSLLLQLREDVNDMSKDMK